MTTDMGFLKWKDPYEYIEKHMHIKKENAIFKGVLEALNTKAATETLAKKYEAYSAENQPESVFNFPTQNPKVIVRTPRAGRYFLWKWSKAGSKWRETECLDISHDYHVAYTMFAKENYMLHVESVRGHHWSHSHTGGAGVVIQGDRVLFIEGDSPLNYSRVISLDLKTGRDRRIIYEEVRQTVEIDFYRAGGALFLESYDSGIQALYEIRGGACVPLGPGVSFFPVGHKIYFVREKKFSDPWKLVGASWKLNSVICSSGIEFCSAESRILITKFAGARTIWRMSEGAPKFVFSDIFEILNYNSWIHTVYKDSSKLYCLKPGATGFIIELGPRIINIGRPAIEYAPFIHGQSKGPDGLSTGWILLGTISRPLGLVVVGYGGYGLSTELDTLHWRPWIEAGWAVAILFLRGGGDSNDTWADLGRLEGKQAALDDVEVCIRDLQGLTGCRAASTVLYGRSAGGLIVGNIVARHPKGDLIGIAYAEVPYVDLLKTAANPELPLTKYEYGEFGDPRAGLAQFESALGLSPIHQLGPAGAPGVKVLCRTGIHDLQVYPYESIKWITALRGSRKDLSKIVYIDTDGHHSLKSERERAEDFSIINAWLSKDE